MKITFRGAQALGMRLAAFGFNCIEIRFLETNSGIPATNKEADELAKAQLGGIRAEPVTVETFSGLTQYRQLMNRSDKDGLPLYCLDGPNATDLNSGQFRTILLVVWNGKSAVIPAEGIIAIADPFDFRSAVVGFFS